MSEAQLPFTLRDAYLREGGEKCAELRKYLNKKTRVHISDGRVFTGYLSVCFSDIDVTSRQLIIRWGLF